MVFGAIVVSLVTIIAVLIYLYQDSKKANKPEIKLTRKRKNAKK